MEVTTIESLIEEREGVKDSIKLIAVAALPTQVGVFKVVAFNTALDQKEHLILVKGEVVGKVDVLVRVHSECVTGEVFRSLRCDCGDQLAHALELIEKAGEGLVIYLRQEGRGIGLDNKIKAYALQDQGYDTFEADNMLGFEKDSRSYTAAAHALKALKIDSVKLITNNQDKIDGLLQEGIKVVERIPDIVTPNSYNEKYLKTKQQKAGHLLNLGM